MKLVVITTNQGRREFMIGDGYEHKTWYWSGNVADAVGTGNLIIKQHCHPGCRLEIPREIVMALEIFTDAHMK